MDLLSITNPQLAPNADLVNCRKKMNKKVTLTMKINPYITAAKQTFRLKQHKCSFYKDFGVKELEAKVKTLHA